MTLKSTRMFSSTLYIADLLLLSQETWKKLDATTRVEKSTIEQSATMSTPLPERFIGQDFSVFLVLITFTLSLQKCLQIAVFFCIYTLLNNVLHQSAPLISLFVTYFTIHPLSPRFHLYFYKHLYLKGWNLSSLY